MIVYCSKCGNKVNTTGFICSICGKDNTPDRDNIMYIRCGDGNPDNYDKEFVRKLQAILNKSKISAGGRL